MTDSSTQYSGFTGKPPIVLVDGSAFMFRAYHALPMLTSDDGHPTNAIRGVFSMLEKLVRDFDQSPIVMIFDPPGGNFRNEIFPEYKANRDSMDDDLRVQIAPIHDFVRALGIPLLVPPNTEADDVIGTLARRAEAEGHCVVICSNDKDLSQLISDQIVLYDDKNKFTDREAVIDKRGVPPERIAELLALWGDTSDNIPGVPGVGEKTAVKWINEYGSLEQIKASAGDIKGKVGENLRGALDDLALYLELTTIRIDEVVEFDINDLSPPVHMLEELQALCKRFGFRQFQGGAGRPAEPKAANTLEIKTQKTQYDLILTTEDLQTWVERLQQAPWFAFDTETDSLNYMSANLIGLSFALPDGRAAYVPLKHDYLGAPAQIDLQQALDQLRPLLESDPPRIVGQNIKYDAHILTRYGIRLAVLSDTMLESYVFNSTASRHNLNALALHYLNHITIAYADIAGKGREQITFNQIHIDQAAPYAAEDAELTARLHTKLEAGLADEKELRELLQTIEIPFLDALQRIERNGVMLDSEMLAEQSSELTKRVKELQEFIWKEAEMEFNLNSPKQLSEVLYTHLKLPSKGRKTSTGMASTAERALKQLSGKHPIIDALLEHRSLDKLRSTYTEVLPKMVNSQTQRVHTSYHQAGTSTGRLSSSDPNLQNIPVRTPEGKRIRSAFIAAPGCLLLAADYSQIELRVMAHLSQDPRMIAAFHEGADIHSTTASEVFDVSLEAVTADQRRRAKAINFGLIYGMSEYGLARQLEIDVPQAKAYMDIYFKRYPKVLKYMEECKQNARDQGYVSTLKGRRLHLKNIDNSNARLRQGSERTAINAPVQGTAADILKIATINLDQWLQQESTPDALIVLQVHDELVLEVLEADLERVSESVREHMQNACALSVPLQVDINYGSNWEAAH